MRQWFLQHVFIYSI